MANQKRTLNAKAVLIDIGVGLTDAQLMMKYQLSAKGLESLKTKLLAAGLLREADLNNRPSSPPPTGYPSITNGAGKLEETVDLDPGTVQFGKVATSVERNAEGKRKLSAKEILAEVTAGLSNAQLMAKHDISGEALEKVLTKLVTNGLIQQPEFDLRMSDLKGDKEQTPTYWMCPSCNMPQPLKCEVCPQCGIIVEKFVKNKAHGTVVEEPVKEPTKVVEQPEQPKEGNQIAVSQIVDDIRSGANFQQLMQKHGLSAEPLQQLLTKMLFAGLLKPSEIATLKPPAKSDGPGTPRPPMPRSSLTISRRSKVLAVVLPLIMVLIAGGVFGVRHYMNVKEKQERLARACASGDVDEAGLLLAEGTGANITDPHGILALVIACSRGHLEVVNLLLENGADPNFRSNDGYWPRLKAIFGKSQGNPEPRNIPLLAAISDGHGQIVKLLLDKGAEVEAQDENRCTALWKALSLGNIRIVEVLLAKGANASSRDKDGNTLLMMAARHGYREMIPILLEKRVDTNLVNSNGDTALMMAAAAGDIRIVSLLLENGAAINFENADGYTALDFSSWSGHTFIANGLTKVGAKSGYKLRKELMLAAADSGDNDILNKVLSRQTDVNSRLENGDSALILAIRKSHRDTVDILLAHGADFTVPERIHHRTPLILAYQKDDAEIVRLLLKKGADPRVAAKDVESPLYMAARDGRTEMMALFLTEGVSIDAKSLTETFLLASLNGHAEVSELLLERGADVTAKGMRGQTALFWASQSHTLDFANQLLARGADVNATDKDGSSPLIVAVRAGRTDMAKLLVNRGANINSADKSGDTALMIASLKGYTEIVKVFLENGADVNATDKDGSSPLIVAVKAGRTDMAKLLVNKGGNINSANRSGETPLMMASLSGDTEIVKLLLENGADVNPKDKNGLTALYLSVSARHMDLARLVLDRGGEVNVKPSQGEPLLVVAYRKGDTGLVRLLVDKGADVNSTGQEGEPLLMIASARGDTDSMRFLLDRKAEVDSKDKEGTTSLMEVSTKGHIAGVVLLLEKGANVNAKTRRGKTPLMSAASSGHTELVKLFLEKGANIEDIDEERKSAMSWASQNHHDELAKFLVESMAENRMRRKGADIERKTETGGQRGAGSR